MILKKTIERPITVNSTMTTLVHIQHGPYNKPKRNSLTFVQSGVY